MPYILAILAAIILAVVLSTACCRKITSGPSAESGAMLSQQTASPGSRADLSRRLKQLSRTKVDKDMIINAMCYVPAVPPPRFEFICPICGSKTLYAVTTAVDIDRPVSAEVFQDAIIAASANRMLSVLPGLKAELDVSQFCKQCSPEANAPKLILIIKYQNASIPHRFEGITPMDFAILEIFLSNESYGDAYYDGHPLTDYLPRLQELLGVKAE